MVQNLIAILDIVYFQTVNGNVEQCTTTLLLKITGDIASRVLKRMGNGMEVNSILNSTEKIIIAEISKREKMFSGEIYSFSSDELGLKKTRTYQILKRLLKIGLLEVTEQNIRGKTRIFKPAQGDDLNEMS